MDAHIVVDAVTGAVRSVPFTADESAGLRSQDALADTAAALLELTRIDLASIRAIREYIAARPDAPQILKEREAAAVAARAKLA